MNKNHHKRYAYQTLVAFIIAGLFFAPRSADLIGTAQKEARITMNMMGSTIYVDDDNVAGPWDGTLEHPYQFIQDGIDHATGGDTVYVFTGWYIENVVISKSLNVIGEERDHTVISGDGFGTVVKIIAERVNVSGFTISDSGSNSNNAGIMIHTSNNTITNNNIQKNDYYGIFIIDGSNNTIYHNNLIDNTYQAFDAVAGSIWDGGCFTGGNYWDDYTGSDENEDGMGDIPYPTGNSSADNYPLIHPYGSVVNKNTEEIFLTIQAAIDDYDTQDHHVILAKKGEYWEHVSIYKSLILQGDAHHDTVINGRNTGTVVSLCANDVTLQWLMIQHSGVDEQNAGISVSGKNCSLIDNIIYGNYHGMILKHTAEDTMIVNNKINHNGWNGITLKSGCKGAHVYENTLSWNFYAGIGISGASYNYFYHNTFESNRYQAYDDATNVWDDGYPSGGNYWNDYTGIDKNGDGIGDTPYAIPGGINKDRYPLMAPYTSEDTVPPLVTIVSPKNGLYLWGFHVLPWLLQRSTIIVGIITIQVEASDAHSGIAKVEFCVDDAHDPVFIDTQEPYSWRWSHVYLFRHAHRIIVVAYDNAGNPNYDLLEAWKYL